MLSNNNDDLHLAHNTERMLRQFTVQTQKKTEALTLSLETLI
jgi:hypothetical protein